MKVTLNLPAGVLVEAGGVTQAFNCPGTYTITSDIDTTITITHANNER